MGDATVPGLVVTLHKDPESDPTSVLHMFALQFEKVGASAACTVSRRISMGLDPSPRRQLIVRRPQAVY